MSITQLNRQLARENRRYPKSRLVEIPPEEWPPPIGRPPLRVLRCREFLVQVYDEPQGWLRISVVRTFFLAPNLMAPNITWDGLQWIKDEAGYGARDAFEAYPRRADVVNVANMRHLWVLPEGELLAGIWRPTARTVP